MLLTVKPNEKGTAVITISCLDVEGDVPEMATQAWQLSDTKGNIINSRTFADNTFTGTEVTLTGEDLALAGPLDNGVRVFGFEGTYTSSAGRNLSLTDEARFTIKPLVSQG